jgi:hypothetical protein
MGHDVFISYSSKDRKAADDLCRALEAGRVRVWMAPRDLTPSGAWAADIPSAIEAARVVILVFSKNTNGSEWVAREIEHAVSCKRRIMTVRLLDAEPSSGLKFYLNTLHWLDAFPGAFHEHLPNVTRQCQQLLDIRPKPNPAPPVKTPAAPTKSEAPAARPRPYWRRPAAVAQAAALVVALLLTASGGVVWLALPARTNTGTDDPPQPPKPSAAASDCSSIYQERLAQPWKRDFDLPGDDGWAGDYTVIDVATLKVRGKIIKLAGVGAGDAQSAKNLRAWLEISGPTVSCKPADEQFCRYTCENESHDDISKHILSSNWASPRVASVSSQN